MTWIYDSSVLIYVSDNYGLTWTLTSTNTGYKINSHGSTSLQCMSGLGDYVFVSDYYTAGISRTIAPITEVPVTNPLASTTVRISPKSPSKLSSV